MSTTVRVHDESPDVLGAGRWVRHGLVMRWQPDMEPEPVVEEERPTLNVRTLRDVNLIACPCGARLNEHCRRADGRKAHDPHRTRLAKRVCQCGADLARGCEFCHECRAEKDRERSRAYKRRTRGAAA